MMVALLKIYGLMGGRNLCLTCRWYAKRVCQKPLDYGYCPITRSV